MKILICDDDIMTLKALDHKLKLEGYETITAKDGKVAIDTLNSNPDIALLLTDLHMPLVSGLELIMHIRNIMKSNMPIVMLTRVGLEDTVFHAFELGADDYITKPFSPEELSLRIKRALLKRKL
ncbi:MAG: response regulator transcription factor [Bacteroidota bacterium]|nr:response regulator transcription factor [Bacteroidota bacterium]